VYDSTAKSLQNLAISTIENKQSKATRIAKLLYILWAPRPLIHSWKHWWFKL